MQNKFARIKETVKKCCVCKTDISAKKATAKTCSNKCKLKLFHNSYKTKTAKCVFCGAKFQYRSAKKKYCNPKCQNSHWRILNEQKKPTIQRKYEILKAIGLQCGAKPPKGGRINIEINEIKIQMYCTDLGGSIAKSPKEIAEVLGLDDIIFLCKCLNINPYKFCSKIEIIEFILLSENYSIIETCINDIWAVYQAPAMLEENEKPTNLLSYKEGVFAYSFFEAKDKKDLLAKIDHYRQFSN